MEQLARIGSPRIVLCVYHLRLIMVSLVVSVMCAWCVHITSSLVIRSFFGENVPSCCVFTCFFRTMASTVCTKSVNLFLVAQMFAPGVSWPCTTENSGPTVT